MFRVENKESLKHVFSDVSELAKHRELRRVYNVRVFSAVEDFLGSLTCHVLGVMAYAFETRSSLSIADGDGELQGRRWEANHITQSV